MLVKYRLWTLSVLLIVGCVASRLEQLDATLLAYERAVRWSNFKDAASIAAQPPASLPDFQRLQDIQVTSYDKVGAPRADADGKKFIQVVEIRYVHLRNMSERRLTDEQMWTFSETDARWKLASAFPAFR